MSQLIYSAVIDFPKLGAAEMPREKRWLIQRDLTRLISDYFQDTDPQITSVLGRVSIMLSSSQEESSFAL